MGENNENNRKEKSIKTEIIAWIKEIVISVIVALLITNFMFTHIIVPTPSMAPTIECNDHFMINKLPMYYRNPQRGEIVVFHGEEKELVKRVVGLPEEVIDIKDGHVYINGNKIEEDYLVEGIITKPAKPKYIDPGVDIKYPYTIPKGSYFVMGDNRENSKDSRYIGTIKREKIYAIAKFRIWPLNSIGNIY
ncbi:MAG: signal peptidase I [Maledivibacter sp.]|jgi:signal peptidase I|nr:signal peptidase I [Maledivibacter sp.]